MALKQFEDGLSELAVAKHVDINIDGGVKLCQEDEIVALIPRAVTSGVHCHDNQSRQPAHQLGHVHQEKGLHQP